MGARRCTACLSGLGLLAAALMAAGGLAPGILAAGDDISGTVTGASGPEAGVWVIAETGDFDTSFRKTVVTDDAGRFLVPDLPDASYEVWVRGYGLVDSERTSARPGDRLELTVRAAATPREAAEIYPANYWYSLLEVPPASDFPGTGPRGNGIGTAMRTQADWIDRMKDGCQLCHQLGNHATREMPMLDLDDFDSTADAWNYRIQAGGAGPAMAAEINRIGRPRAIRLYAEWTDRIRAGEVPPAPPRPQGVERNVVLTSWGWGHPRGMVHDNVSTDKRNPTLYPNGPVYGVGGAGLVITDIAARRSVRMDLPTRIERPRRATSYEGSSTRVPSLYWGDEPAGLVSRSAHNPMMDEHGRLWITQAVRPNDVPGWCLEGSDHPFARYYPIQHRDESRQVSYYDPETGEFELIDTCFFTHHLQFADDADDTLWLSGSTEAVGWLNTRLYDETGDERAAQGWCPTVIDTNGDGVITRSRGTSPTGTARSRSTRRGTPASAASTSSAAPTASSPTPTARSGSPGASRCRGSSSGSSGATTRRRPARPRSTSRPTIRTATPVCGATARAASTSTATGSCGPRWAAAATSPASTAASARC